jgi:guanosine-3',5'-bis(diphosphate) 3'-pyrophosphohydrolase
LGKSIKRCPFLICLFDLLFVAQPPSDPMTATVQTLNIDCVLPSWLESCLLNFHDDDVPGDSEAVDDNAVDKSNNLLVCRAFEFAHELHRGQRRASGEPYICHPIEVAGLLRDLGGDSAMIASGFLHDVVEDTDITLEEIEERFGSEVRQLVEGVTKLSKFNFESKTERQAENFRRMFLAMAQDIRVIVVKLADRLHNMRTSAAPQPRKAATHCPRNHGNLRPPGQPSGDRSV